MKVSILFTLVIVSTISLSAHASLVIHTTPNKLVYQLGETVNITITVFNSGSTTETLMGGGTYVMEDGSSGIIFTDYILEESYIWSDYYKNTDGSGLMWALNFLPGQMRTWDMIHGTEQMQDYPLNIGFHSVVGKAGFTLYSNPVTFQVIPEPTTLCLFAFGAVLLKRKR